VVGVVIRSGGDGDAGDGGGARAAGRDGEATTPAPAASGEPMELLWSTPQLHAVNRPKLVGGRVVAHVVEGDGLALVAFDPRSGAEVWRRPSTASWITPGVAFTVLADDQRLFHLVPGPNGSASVEALDAASGQVVWTSSPALLGFRDPLDFCEDDESTLCISSVDTPGQPVRWRIDPTTGEHIVRVAAGGRELGSGVYDLYDNGDIALVRDDEVVWQRSPSELFEGHDVNPDNGWLWRPADDGDVLVGWLGAPAEWPEEGQAGQTTLVPQYTAGIDAATGRTLWVAEGDPCTPRLIRLVYDEDEEVGPWVRCTSTGTVSLDAEGIVDADVDVVVEGFDPATGEARWTQRFEGVPSLWVDTEPMVRLGPTTAAFARADGTLLALDMASGETTEPESDQVGWCFEHNVYEGVEPDGERNQRVGQDFAAPCDASGAPAPAPSHPDEGVGVVADGTFVWMDAAGLHAARVPT
jgi:outer membrane protein assembly factor BamB